MTVPEVDQTFFEVKPWMKLEMLCRLIDTYTPTSSLVFCNTKRRVDQIVKDLQERGYRVDSLHGDMTQSRRDYAMSKFRSKALRILVATDVAARGIDVDDIEAVINYDVPQDDQHYVHRIGRTARMGKNGHAFTLVLPDQLSKLREIQEKANTQIKRQITPHLRTSGSEEGRRRMGLAANRPTVCPWQRRAVLKGRGGSPRAARRRRSPRPFPCIRGSNRACRGRRRKR